MSSSDSQNKKMSLFPVLLVGFIDHMGVGLVYPLFAALLFNDTNAIVAPETSYAMRGWLLGILIALTPIAQFFACPILGALSDQKGRKPILSICIGMGLASYVIAAIGIFYSNIALLFLYRFLVGVSDGSIAVAQAALTDVSDDENKSKRFGLFNMFLGAGFTIGPFLGGKLSDSTISPWFGYMTPFLFSGVLCLINIVLLYCMFSETLVSKKAGTVKMWDGIHHFKKAFKMKTLRILFLAMFAFTFGWTFFTEFVPVFLMDRFDFGPSKVGDYYAYTGIWYAFSAGVLSRPILKAFPAHHLFTGSLLMTGAAILMFLAFENEHFMWLFVPFMCLFLALVYPTASTLVSDSADKDSQGEAMGVYMSVISVAYALSPLVAGSLVAEYPPLVVICGATFMFLGGIIYSFNRVRQTSPVVDAVEG